MAEYSLDFSKNLIRAARAVRDKGEDTVDAKRTILYLSLLSCEITMKALLERAGKPVKKIKHRSHNLEGLLRDVCRCEVKEEIVNGKLQWVIASRLRGQGVATRPRISSLTMGKFLTGENQGASRYPNEIRYGDKLFHFPPDIALNASHILIRWAREKWDEIRL